MIKKLLYTILPLFSATAAFAVGEGDVTITAPNINHTFSFRGTSPVYINPRFINPAPGGNVDRNYLPTTGNFTPSDRRWGWNGTLVQAPGNNITNATPTLDIIIPPGAKKVKVIGKFWIDPTEIIADHTDPRFTESMWNPFYTASFSGNYAPALIAEMSTPGWVLTPDASVVRKITYRNVITTYSIIPSPLPQEFDVSREIAITQPGVEGLFRLEIKPVKVSVRYTRPNSYVSFGYSIPVRGNLTVAFEDTLKGNVNLGKSVVQGFRGQIPIEFNLQ